MPKNTNLARVLFSLLFLVVPQADASNRAFFFGGNCEDHNASNQFIPSTVNMVQSLRSRGWIIDSVLFGNERTRRNPNDPGHSIRSIANASNLATNQIAPASREQLLTMMDRIADDPSVDATTQLLFSFQDHGQAFDGHYEFCLADGTYMRTDDSALQLRLRRIYDRGARLGFLLGTCFSGAALPDLEPYGCVMTAASAYEAAWGGNFESLFANFMALPDPARITLDLNNDGRLTMEEAFLYNLTNRQIYNMPDLSGLPPSIEQDYASLVSLPQRLSGLPQDNRTCDQTLPLATFETLFDMMRKTEAPTTVLQIQQYLRSYIRDPYILNDPFSDALNLPTSSDLSTLRSSLSRHASEYARLAAQERELLQRLNSIRANFNIRLAGPRGEWDSLFRQILTTRSAQPVSLLFAEIQTMPPAEQLAFESAIELLRRFPPETSLGNRLRQNQLPIIRDIQRRLTINAQSTLRNLSPSIRNTAQDLRRQIGNTRLAMRNAWHEYSGELSRMGRMAVNGRFADYLRYRTERLQESRALRTCSEFVLY